MPDTDLKKLSNEDFAKAKQEFLKHQKQVVRTERLTRQAEYRVNAPKPEDLNKLTNAEFERAKQNCLKNLRR